MHTDRSLISQNVFIWSSLWVVCIIRTFCMKFKIPLHHCIFAITCGFCGAFVVNYLEKRMYYRSILHLYYLDALFFYLPGTVFNTSFRLDNYVFLKTLSQILVISLPISLLTGACTGLLFRVVMKPNWPRSHAVMFGVNCAQIYASYTSQYLQRLSHHMKHTSTLLDGEAIISNINCYLVYMLLIGHSTGLFVEWYHYALTVVRLLGMGLLSGYLFGLLGRFLIRTMYTDQMGVVMVTIAIPYFTFGLTEIYLGGCGTLAVMIIGLIMNKERPTLSPDSDHTITDILHATEVLLTVYICLQASFQIAYKCLDGLVLRMDWIFTVTTYVLYTTMRFFCFLIFVPITSRLGYGMDVKSMVICVFGGLKHPLCLLFAGLYNRRIRLDGISLVDRVEFKFHVFGLYFLSYLINGAFIPLLLRVMGVSEMSMAKLVNMNNCMKHIFAKRERALAVLKMDRYINDANWVLINEATAIRHPDKVGAQADDDDYFMGYRYTYCGDCKKDVAEEPTKKEMKEMSKEAKMRVLKAMKMSYARQYENGMVSKEGIRILNQAVEFAMDSEAAVIEIDGLHKRFNQESCFKRFIRRRIQKLSEKQRIELKPPKTYWKRVCYHLVKSRWFNPMMYALNTIHVVLLVGTVILSIIELHMHTMKHKDGPHRKLLSKSMSDSFFAMKILFFLIFLLEFVIRLMASSRTSYRMGLKIYFKSPWNTIDFIVLLLLFLDVNIVIVQKLGPSEADTYLILSLRIVLDLLKMIRILKLVQILKEYYPAMIRYLDTSVDANMAFTYELGKAYVNTVDEVEQMLPQIIDHDRIKEELKQQLEQDKVHILKLLGMVQKERPWIAITVKTKQVIRTVNNAMKECIMQLKSSGWIDQMEYDRLMKSLAEVYKQVNSIKSVQPSPPEVIFKELSWMAGEEAVFDFLFENVSVKRYEPKEVVFEEGMVADGIYVVVTGLFELKYKPENSVLHSLEEYGQLPIADYVLPTEYYEKVSDYIVSGNCMGELSVLTGRAYNCTIIADAHSQVYVLTNNVLRRAMELSADPVLGLQCRIWKTVSLRLAVPILMAVPAYQSFSQDQIKYTLERAFIPDLANYKIFVVTEIIMDIILVEGLAADFHTRDTYSAPCYIPRTVQKLILPKSSLINIPIDIEVKLLIIPEKDVDEVDVMMLAEETCEMLAQDSSYKCLQHTVLNRNSRLRRRNRIMEEGSSNMRRRRFGRHTKSHSSSGYSGDDMIMSSSSRMSGLSMMNMSEVEMKSQSMSGNKDLPK